MWDDEPDRPVWKGIGGVPGRRRYQRRTAKNGEQLSPPHGLILRPRAHTTTLLIGRVVHHSKLRQRMSALGQKRTLEQVKAMSALLPKADIETQSRDVRFVPKADIGGRQCYSRADLIVTLKEAKKKRSVAKSNSRSS